MCIKALKFFPPFCTQIIDHSTLEKKESRITGFVLDVLKTLYRSLQEQRLKLCSGLLRLKSDLHKWVFSDLHSSDLSKKKFNRVNSVYLFRGNESFKGVSLESYQGLDQIIRKLFLSSSISPCDGIDISPSKWSPSALFVLPGGVCTQWEQLIDECRQDSLLNWVEKGGRIFAVCAGAYFCSSRSIYSVSSVEKIEKVRRFALFPGICQGPAFSSQLTVEKVVLEKTGETGYVVVIGGGVFIPSPDKNGNSYEVLARFTDKPPLESAAVVACSKGKGIAVLSSPHWEISEIDIDNLIKLFPTREAEYKKLQTLLASSRSFREKCLNEMKKVLEGGERL